MPESPTGGPEGRDNTRPSGVAPGYVRITIAGATLTFTHSSGSVLNERIVQAEQNFDNVTYTSEAGRTWTLPIDWRDEATIPMTQVRRGPDRAVPPTRYVVDQPATYGGYRVGVNFEPTFTYSPAVTYNATYGAAATCDCEGCRQLRMGTPSDSPEQRERRQAAERVRQDRIRAEEQKMAEIDARAEETLRMVLRPDELAHYEKNHELIVTGADGMKYRIGPGLIGNVQLLNEAGNPMANACCHPDLYPEGFGDSLPMKDAHIAQILYLRHDLEKFWKTANVGWFSSKDREKYFRDHPFTPELRRWPRHLVRSVLA